MSETEQNKKINQLRRQLALAIEKIKILELDMEPEGRITMGFNAMEEHMDEKFAQVDHRFAQMDEKFAQVDRRFDRLEHQFNRLQAKLEVILEAITGLADLPEDETSS